MAPSILFRRFSFDDSSESDSKFPRKESSASLRVQALDRPNWMIHWISILVRISLLFLCLKSNSLVHSLRVSSKERLSSESSQTNLQRSSSSSKFEESENFGPKPITGPVSFQIDFLIHHTQSSASPKMTTQTMKRAIWDTENDISNTDDQLRNEREREREIIRIRFD